MSGVFDSSRDVIPLLDQIIMVNGVEDSALWCISISRQSGCGGVTADFTHPLAGWDTARDSYRDAYVEVYILNTYSSPAASGPDFAGYLDVDTGSLSQGDDTVAMSAHSITHYLNRVWVGQADHRPVVTYRVRDIGSVPGADGRYPLVSPRVTVTSILRDILGDLPSYYYVRLRLGDVSVLSTSDMADLPDQIVFRGTTYAAAIDQLLGYYGDVGVCERYESSKTYLDFYRISDPSAPISTVTVAPLNQDVISGGGNVASITENLTSADAVTRVIAYGRPRVVVISCSTADAVTARKLQPDWPSTYTTGGITYNLESLVAGDPKKARPGAPGYLPGMEHVYRRYRLPACLRHYTIARDLAPIYRTASAGDTSSPYQTQVWWLPTSLSDDGVGSNDKVGTTVSAPVLCKQFKLDLDRRTVTLAKPALAVTAVTMTSGKPVYTYAAATVGVTLAVELADYVYHDTTATSGGGIAHDFASDGLTEIIQRDDAWWCQITNAGYALGGYTFGTCHIVNESTGAASTYSAATLVRDDTPALRELALQVLREKCRRHRSYNVSIPYYTRAYRIGNRMVVIGQADYYAPDTYMITGIDYDLTDQSTTITCDNVKPPHRRTVKLGGKAVDE